MLRVECPKCHGSRLAGRMVPEVLEDEPLLWECQECGHNFPRFSRGRRGRDGASVAAQLNEGEQ